LERERELLLRPAWQFVGCLSQLPYVGDYLTTELLGTPLIVWRTAEGVRTFLNVCPHRFSRISGNACGHAEETLQCQYHGWVFDTCGQTRRIPDARSFKPMTRGALCLTSVRTEVCGQMIFCNLSDDAPSLREFLGAGYEICETVCGTGLRHIATLPLDVACNWKIKVENSLESYHLATVHRETIGRIPEPEECEHEIGSHYSTFITRMPAPDRTQAVLDDVQHRLAGMEKDPEYTHWFFYPNIMFGKMRLFSWTEMIWPTSPTTNHTLSLVFCNPGERGLRSRILFRGLRRWGRWYFRKLGLEDKAALEEVQRGCNSPRMPSPGVISIREERCFHFQDYVVRATARGEAVEQRRTRAPARP
ncbi:MAG: aromatic ring-hydroxylating oxygenase subunit alpha, partial [Planctomycetaceae bacterium]